MNKEEALERLHRAVEAGLVPVVGKVKIDAIGLGVKEHNRLMTICHCCSCCCLTGGVHYAPRDVRDIQIIDDVAVVGKECKGCGRCTTICPNDAISIIVDNPDYINQCIERISAYVDVT